MKNKEIKEALEILKFIKELDNFDKEIIIAGIESVIEILEEHINKKIS